MQPRSNRKHTLLIVDDEPRILDSVRMNLELEGYQVFEATNGQEALDQVRLRLPDLVVMDVMMPQMDGFEALRALRKFSSVPVVLLTVKADERDVIHGLELGADDYIAKPFSPGVLLSRIKAVLRRAEAPSQAPLSRELRVDDRLTINFDRHEVGKDGQRVQLPDRIPGQKPRGRDEQRRLPHRERERRDADEQHLPRAPYHRDRELAEVEPERGRCIQVEIGDRRTLAGNRRFRTAGLAARARLLGQQSRQIDLFLGMDAAGRSAVADPVGDARQVNGAHAGVLVQTHSIHTRPVAQ